MKRFTLLAVATLLTAGTALAQNSTLDATRKQDTTKRLTPPAGSLAGDNKPVAPKRAFNNEVRINLPSLALGNISLQYERAITPKFSAGLGVRMGPERAMPFSGSLEKAFDNDSVARELISGTRLSNYAITPEIRYYFGKRHMSGFYMGLFGRFGKFSLSMPFTLNDQNFANGKQTVLLTGDYTYGGAGIQLGAKFNVSNRVSLDWFFLGPMFTAGTVNLDAAIDLSNMTASGRDETVRELVEVFSNGTATVDNQGVHIQSSLPLAGIRTGLAIGFRF